MPTPGPICTWDRDYLVDDGTSCRMPSQTPGPAERRSPWVWERGEALYEAYGRAQLLAPGAILRRTGYALEEVLAGLVPGLLEMLLVLGATTALGAAVGGVIGFFFGGAGAAPGIVIGADVGFDVGMAALTWLGVAFLAKAMWEGFAQLWAQLSTGVSRAWHAPEFPESEYPHQIEQAGREIADALGILMLLLLQAIVAWVLKRAAMNATQSAARTIGAAGTVGAEAAAEAAVAELAAKLRASKLGGGFANWIEKNWAKLRDDPRLRPKEVRRLTGPTASSSTSGETPSKKAIAPRSAPSGKTYSGKVVRATNPKYADSAFDIHQGNVDANHRYSGPGTGAIYTSTSERAMNAEMEHYGVPADSQSVVSKDVTIDNVLDLTDPQVRQQLGVTEAQLTGDDYSTTQAIGQWASTRYNAALVPSARAPGTTNLVIFNPGAMK